MLNENKLSKSDITSALINTDSKDVAKRLINTGADIDEAYTKTQKEDIAQFLKASGAKIPESISLTKIANMTCLQDAVENYPSFQAELKRNGGKLLLGFEGELVMFKYLVSAGADIHAIDEDGNTLLHRYNIAESYIQFHCCPATFQNSAN